ncbi:MULTISPECIES: Hsp20 family protein [unclassified Aureimonas]|uniref:Hsp20 family protein n=1 Tax=unclassified Aureimonas TaxID=2615206 RepID=UPI0006F6B6DC|nr:MULTISPECIES: Hsp20 family protein [unclassified Aureimonas]KQT64345.1 heat-shock protein Hsp20 [Aureimonas sp. Leaf427]KQT81534.1 heat-shock protein Hsp20 [Aureimonas sp. Leaf460]
MSRVTPFSSPLLLGFDAVEKTLERIGKGGEGYPPYNIERIRGRLPDEPPANGRPVPDILRITLAVAGFRPDDLEVTTEENQLTIRGRQAEDKDREFLHRGIAARQFQKSFLFADGMQILGAQLKNGLLLIDLARPEPERIVKRIEIAVSD